MRLSQIGRVAIQAMVGRKFDWRIKLEVDSEHDAATHFIHAVMEVIYVHS